MTKTYTAQSCATQSCVKKTCATTSDIDLSKRDFITLTASSMAVIGAASIAWPLIDSLNPAADVLALSSTEVDLSNIKEGQTIKVVWRGKPVFIKHRTSTEIQESIATNITDLRDPETDAQRVLAGHAQWLVMIGVCTHLGCIPIVDNGDYPDGFFCPCHGSHYDSCGRIRKGPAPKNLVIPPYSFVAENKILIG